LGLQEDRSERDSGDDEEAGARHRGIVGCFGI
jgi:hypothetical protein